MNKNTLRHKLNKLGYSLRKSRVNNINLDNLGGYMIIDTYGNYVVAGSRFELTIDDVISFLEDVTK
ncbi:hypothetical protein [Butyrivibrio sp. AD3002]|uniref:hypothetical protein n=1 Tax=Butyrivibrio sp. AD3002 TaxID=1280670 RepID=UPI0003B511F4|nr:hypothetical protein [Butyrivibrio sp. AD3002]